MSERRHPTVFPGFREMAERRHSVSGQLMYLRRELGLSQAEVTRVPPGARMWMRIRGRGQEVPPRRPARRGRGGGG